MKNITPFLISFLISGLEPFSPVGSPVIALAAVLGTKYPNSRGIIIVILIGLVRDALLVNRLGVSSLVTVFAWFIAAFAAARLGRPLAVSIVAAGLAALTAATDYRFILATAALAGIFVMVWGWISEKDEKIRVRNN